jgi:hypothetical protein
MNSSGNRATRVFPHRDFYDARRQQAVRIPVRVRRPGALPPLYTNVKPSSVAEDPPRHSAPTTGDRHVAADTQGRKCLLVSRHARSRRILGTPCLRALLSLTLEPVRGLEWKLATLLNF